MPHFEHPIINEVVGLKLPYPEEVIINHGAALVVRGLRKEHFDGDIDFSTNLENIRYLREQLGWQAVSMNVGLKSDGTMKTILATRDVNSRFDAHRWDFSMSRYRHTSKGRIYLPEQGARSEQDERTGIWIANLEYVRETKLETGREKDIADIKLIDVHLASE